MCIASTLCIQDYVHPKRIRCFCALRYTCSMYGVCVCARAQMHKHKCTVACLPIGQCNFRLAFGFDSGIRALTTASTYKSSPFGNAFSYTNTDKHTHTRTHANAFCIRMNAHLCARAVLFLFLSLSVYMCACLCEFKFRIRYQRTGVRKTFQSAIVCSSYLGSNIERNRKKKRYVLDIHTARTHSHTHTY